MAIPLMVWAGIALAGYISANKIPPPGGGIKAGADNKTVAPDDEIAGQPLPGYPGYQYNVPAFLTLAILAGGGAWMVYRWIADD